jgi:hypothetical protein
MGDVNPRRKYCDDCRRKRNADRNRKRYHEDPEYRERILLDQKERNAEARRQRLATPPICRQCQRPMPGVHSTRQYCDKCRRERQVAGTREWRSRPEAKEWLRAYSQQRNRDPEYRDRKNARSRERYETDPDYRERMLELARDPAVRERNNARNRERYRTDPEYRERLRVHYLKSHRQAESCERCEAPLPAGTHGNRRYCDACQREVIREIVRERYRTDPGLRARRIAATAEANRQEKEAKLRALDMDLARLLELVDG